MANKLASKLLLDESPLVVLPSLAVEIGLNESIFLQQLHYWTLKPDSGRTHDSRKWVFNTVEKWKEQFPFWSIRTLERIIRSLVKSGIVLVKQLDAHKYDHKNFYSIDYQVLEDRSRQNGGIEDDKLAGSDSAKMADSLTETSQRFPTETSNTPEATKKTEEPPRYARTVSSAGNLSPEKKSEMDALWKVLDEFQGLPSKDVSFQEKKKRSGFSFSYATLYAPNNIEVLSQTRELLTRWLKRSKKEDLIPHTPKDRWAWIFEEFEAGLGLVAAQGFEIIVKNLNRIIEDDRFRKRLKSLRQYQSLVYEIRSSA